jgi:hypothetical protein
VVRPGYGPLPRTRQAARGHAPRHDTTILVQENGAGRIIGALALDTI